VRAQHLAARHILASPTVAARAAPHVREDGFDWEALFAEAESMSGGEQVLLRIAYDLCEAEGVVGVWELPERLDRRNFERVVEALGICRWEPSLEAAA
jgi:hypothetical protein